MIKCTLKTRGEDSFDNMYKANAKLESDMLEFISGKGSDEELLNYANTLVKKIRKDLGCQSTNYWCVAKVTEGMPGDTSVDLIYRPTYIATCILMQAWLKCEELRSSETFKNALSGAMDGCMGRNFNGHGFDAREGFITTMHIFEAGKVSEFIGQYPDINRKFTDMYLDALDYYNSECVKS